MALIVLLLIFDEYPHNLSWCLEVKISCNFLLIQTDLSCTCSTASWPRLLLTNDQEFESILMITTEAHPAPYPLPSSLHDVLALQWTRMKNPVQPWPCTIKPARVYSYYINNYFTTAILYSEMNSYTCTEDKGLRLSPYPLVQVGRLWELKGFI